MRHETEFKVHMQVYEVLDGVMVAAEGQDFVHEVKQREVTGGLW